MEARWSGKVKLRSCDGVPGNCTLFSGTTKLVEEDKSLRGNTVLYYESRFPILYLQDRPVSWMEELETWCREKNAQEESTDSVWLEDPACKQNKNGLYEYTATLAVRYVRLAPAQEQPEPLFTIDGKRFAVEVMSLTREFELAGNTAVTLDGTRHRDILGSYCHYEMTIQSRNDRQALEEFWEAVSAPRESLLCRFPYGQQWLEQKMFVEGGSQKLLDARNGNRWDAITLRFVGSVPRVAA